jgi:eukaryotic-like serine/threonine-protein kinase
MPPRVAATIMSSVLHGLHAAHQTKDEHGRELGIVHRDVSPQNILIGADGTARVLDFGVAKAAGRLQTTRDGQVKGKIAYMPPEQLGGAPVSKQVDIYASAVVLWEALASQRLFDGETEAIVFARAIEGRIDPPTRYNPSLHGGIDELVMRGLARDPATRYATAREMAMAIEQTIGLASPSEVGEWVEMIAADELGRRAASVAAIEAASYGASDPRIGLGDRVPPEVPHSQVSSISVSRPAISVHPPKRGRGAKVLFGFAALLAISGAALGALAMKDVLAPARHGTPNQVERDVKKLTVLRPELAAGKTGLVAKDKEKEPTPSPTRQPVVAPPPPKKPPPPVANACDPPYTIDPATGRKKYKLECLK